MRIVCYIAMFVAIVLPMTAVYAGRTPTSDKERPTFDLNLVPQDNEEQPPTSAELSPASARRKRANSRNVLARQRRFARIRAAPPDETVQLQGPGRSHLTNAQYLAIERKRQSLKSQRYLQKDPQNVVKNRQAQRLWYAKHRGEILESRKRQRSEARVRKQKQAALSAEEISGESLSRRADISMRTDTNHIMGSHQTSERRIVKRAHEWQRFDVSVPQTDDEVKLSSARIDDSLTSTLSISPVDKVTSTPPSIVPRKIVNARKSRERHERLQRIREGPPTERVILKGYGRSDLTNEQYLEAERERSRANKRKWLENPENRRKHRQEVRAYNALRRAQMGRGTRKSVRSLHQESSSRGNDLSLQKRAVPDSILHIRTSVDHTCCCT